MTGRGLEMVFFDIGGVMYDDSVYARSWRTALRESGATFSDEDFEAEYVHARAAQSGSFRRRLTRRFLGSDADLVVWDPEKQLTISAQTHHTNVNYNLFEGTKVTGAPEAVLVRGQVIVENDELVAEPGAGRFVKRARVGEKLLAAGKEEAVAA